MKQIIEKYVNENHIINICLTNQYHTYISGNGIFICPLTLENDNTLEKIIISNKYISIEFYYELDSYKKINILRYADEISFYKNNMTNEGILDVIHQSINLQKLTVKSSHIYGIDVKKKLSKKEFLKYIKIIFVNVVILDDIYAIIGIKSLDTLCLFQYTRGCYLNSENILKILCYIVNNLNKNIKIIFDFYGQDNKFRKSISLITYNFKINNLDYIFTYIPSIFGQFDNLYDFNLCYQ